MDIPGQRRLLLLVAVRGAVVGVDGDGDLAAGGQPVGDATHVVSVLRAVDLNMNSPNEYKVYLVAVGDWRGYKPTYYEG